MRLYSVLKRTVFSIGMGFKRFPVTLLLTASTSILLIIISEISSSGGSASVKTLSRIAMVLAFGIPISLCIKLYFERAVSIKPRSIMAAYLSLTVILPLYYYFLLPNENMIPLTRYIAFNIAFYLAALFLPYFFTKENYELFIIKIMTSFIVTLVFSGVIFFGVSAILFTVDKLLDVPVYSRLYLYSWIVIAGIFAPSYFLSSFPGYSYEFDRSNYSKFLKILLLYIVMPLISIYTFILYIYLGKVAVTLKWPVGMVGNLVLWYSLLSTLVIFLVWPLISETQWVRTFIFWFTKLILPLMIIMFISLGIRIRAFGITENRYYVIVLGLWVSGIMIYWNLCKYKRNIVLPITLAIIAVLSVTGPWSSYSISMHSQNKRFENILLKYNMITDNKIVKPSGPVSDNDAREINAILMYFSNNHSLKNVKFLPADFKLENMKDTFGFEYNPNIYDQGYMKYFSYFLNNIKSPFDISGYDLLFSFKPNGTLISQSKNDVKIEYRNETNEVFVYYKGKEIYRNDFNLFIKKLYDKYGMNEKQELSPDDMVFSDENQSIKIKFIIYSANGSKNISSDKLKIDYIDFDVLLKIK